MEEFLSSPFFTYGGKNSYSYGKPNRLFDALQIVFSHLVLHPSSAFAATVSASRGNYDLSIIYLYGVPLRTIYHIKLSQLEDVQPQKRNMRLDLYALLHIRNFWHAHLSYGTRKYTNPAPTYGEMARVLAEQNHAPRQWDGPIQYSSKVRPHWFGHYSCTHPTPRKLMDIEEHETCAEDWNSQDDSNGVHPLKLDIATTTLLRRGWWPPIFATVPILESTTPPTGADDGHVYIRGIAPFLAPSKHPDMYPAYRALRVRGVIHPLPEQQEIPGWRRIVMVLFVPTPRYLLAVLDENSPDDDDPFGQIDPIAALPVPTTSGAQHQNADQAAAQDQVYPENQSLAQDQAQTQNQAQTVAPNTEQVEKAIREELGAREELKGPLGPVYLTRDFIAEMEDNLHPPEELAWEDIDFAYIYEGIVIPGGRIMMGRYWRCGAPTVVAGFELGAGADRGPWVFWC
jgi:hypothetical protein